MSYKQQAAIAQSVVRNIGSVEVTSSILVSSSEIVKKRHFKEIALWNVFFDNQRLSYYPESMIFFYPLSVAALHPAGN